MGFFEGLNSFSRRQVDEFDSKGLEGARVTADNPQTQLRWGVTTGRVNPISGVPYVTAFATKAEALNYARRRAASAKTSARKEGRSAAYYVVDGPDRQYAIYKVVRGWLQKPGERHRAERQEAVMVFKPRGDDYDPSMQLALDLPRRWALQPGLSITLVALEEQWEKQRMLRGERKMSREERMGPSYSEELVDEDEL